MYRPWCGVEECSSVSITEQDAELSVVDAITRIANGEIYDLAQDGMSFDPETDDPEDFYDPTNSDGYDVDQAFIMQKLTKKRVKNLSKIIENENESRRIADLASKTPSEPPQEPVE